MKIIELKSSNIKRLKAIELHIDENQNLIMITGKNGQGKSSVLDSIWYALGGKRAAQDKPIRDGQEKGEVELTIKSEKGTYLVKRTFTDKGSYLSVTNSDGAKYGNPQEFLDFIVGNLSFDPLEFSRMDAKKQVAELVKVVGLDFSDLDEKKKQLTEERLLVGREEKSLPKYNDGVIAEAEALNINEVSISDLSAKLEMENARRTAYESAQEKISVNESIIRDREGQIAQLQQEIKTRKDEIAKAKGVLDTTEDLDALRASLAEADETNKKIRKAKEILESAEKVKAKKDEYASLTTKLEAIEEEKKKKLSAAKMPIDGLSWDEDKVLYNNIPYDQISSAEQLKVSMAIAMAANPKLRMLQIRDGSLLDKDNLKVIEEMTKGQDFQAWVERVDESGKVGIVISDGEIKKINE
ncbi:MAG: AAA family ATPase [Candidatus Omnitrophota bacterium]|jgi:DNA repair exonuclease SbcCD ATPase subunit